MQGDSSNPHDGSGRHEEHASELGFDPKEVLAAAAGFAREHPHAAVLGASAVGFLLGGGLTPRLFGAAALVVARRYFNQTMRETLDGVLRGQVGARVVG